MPSSQHPRVLHISCTSSGNLHERDRKSTRLNSSHLVISYAVFCLKKKNTQAHKNTDSILRVNHYPCDPRQQEPYDPYHETTHAKHCNYHNTPLIRRHSKRECHKRS